jgi:hypothetical protein
VVILEIQSKSNLYIIIFYFDIFKINQIWLVLFVLHSYPFFELSRRRHKKIYNKLRVGIAQTWCDTSLIDKHTIKQKKYFKNK